MDDTYNNSLPYDFVPDNYYYVMRVDVYACVKHYVKLLLAESMDVKSEMCKPNIHTNLLSFVTKKQRTSHMYE